VEKAAKKQAEERAFVQHSGQLISNILLSRYSIALSENPRGFQTDVDGLSFEKVQLQKIQM